MLKNGTDNPVETGGEEIPEKEEAVVSVRSATAGEAAVKVEQE